MKAIITKLRKLNVNLTLVDGKLKINAPQGVLTGDLVQEIKENKEYLTSYLEEVARKNSFVKIDKVENKEHYKLSSAQRRLYFLYQFDSTSTVYNLPQTVRLTGIIDKERFNKAFQQLLQRHECLRTSFELINNEPLQKVHDEVNFGIEYLECQESELQLTTEKFIRPFDLQSAPLIRVGIVSTTPEEHLLIVDIHHIVTDGVSQAVLIQDFMAFYNHETLPPIALTYKDYAEWQQSEKQQEEIAKQRDFWKAQFASQPALLELPLDHKRPPVRKHGGAAVDFEISKAEAARLQAIADQEGATLFMVVLAIYNILLAKLCNQEDIVIGTPVAGRQHADLENLIGMFVNTVALRNYPASSHSFKDFLISVKENTHQCFAHQTYQYEELIDDLQVTRDTSRNPLFDVMFVFQNFSQTELEIPGLTLEPQTWKSQTSKFDIALSTLESDEGLSFSFEYSTELFDSDTIERFVTYFKQIISAVIEDVDIRISDIDILPVSEKQQLLQEFNDTRAEYPTEKGIISMFERQVETNPESIAVQYGEDHVTYRQLNHKANQIAHQINEILDKNGLKRVALLFGPSVELIASMLAVLKTGCAYVPLSPDEADARNILKFSDCEAQLLLTHEAFKKHQSDFISQIEKERVVYVNEAVLEVSEEIRAEVSPEDPIYIIYTSGTTGKPKGVEVLNQGILNMVYHFQQKFEVVTGTKLSQVANVIFDASAFEIWPALAFGGVLNIAPAEIRFDPSLMKSWLADNSIEITYQPTAIAEYLLKADWPDSTVGLRVMNIAGDRLNYKSERDLPFAAFNLYGPTEDSIWTTSCEYPYPGDHYSIGKPVANKRILILGENGELLPVGVAGEICVSGAGVAKGYVNNPDLTHEKFGFDPYNDQWRMYKTGDWGRWLKNGHIEFLGRIDRQVKIRGYRIELGEIERQLAVHPAINEIAVIDIDKRGNKYLVAYYVAKETVEPKVLREYLADVLPDYMIPSLFVPIEELPLTANGKLNRSALPEPEITTSDTYQAASNEVEAKLVEIWSEILGLDADKIGVNSNFFELGGHSIRIIELKNKVNEYFNSDFSVASMFRLTTISKIADHIINGDTGVKEMAEKLDEELMEAEDNLSIFNQMDDY
ncbi:amino acid adenylation domain-containing protein [Fulvivirga ulvae]|uniref:non-ribosomal peptide synthetase n=1 Tax=Fulvivirga ulvae TaxID=2904245 RepID=UPI001F305D5E|nr:non-ribosomal peptide synthetase [Fulvivirga ulvae]UII31962.1 amino acid adenylation domain-containing protein [Fulvivirga ulvae]